MKEQKYNAYLKEIGKFIPKDRIYTDELRLLAWGTDAGFYRLIPKIVIRAKDENEVSRLLALADKYINVLLTLIFHYSAIVSRFTVWYMRLLL